jgi:hypothetical protein
VTALVLDARPDAGRVLAQGLALSVGCDEPCTVTAELRATSATARALRRRGVRAGGVLARGTRAQLGAGTRAVRVALNATGRRALRKLRRGTYTLTVTVADRAGNARHEAHRLRPR